LLVSTLLRAKNTGAAVDPAALTHARAWLAGEGASKADATTLADLLA